jgi:hypothetical protein
MQSLLCESIQSWSPQKGRSPVSRSFPRYVLSLKGESKKLKGQSGKPDVKNLKVEIQNFKTKSKTQESEKISQVKKCKKLKIFFVRQKFDFFII